MVAGVLSISVDIKNLYDSFNSYRYGSRNEVAVALREKAKELRFKFDLQ